MNRLPSTHVYHATELSKPCLRPSMYAETYGEGVRQPGTLKTFGGSVGHKVLADIHQGDGAFGLSSKAYADLFEAVATRDLPALCDPDGGFTLDGVRSTWLDEEPSDVKRWAVDEAPEYGDQIANWCRWWRHNVGEPTAGVLGVELPYTMEIESSGDPYKVEGMIDLVFRHPDTGTSFVLDWKFGTGKRGGLGQIQLELDYQLWTYALALRDGEIGPWAENGLPGLEVDRAGFLFMEDLSVYKRRQAITCPKFPTDSRREWVDMHLAKGMTHFEAGDLKGPVLHDCAVRAGTLDLHRDEMKARMAATRTGGALVRVRGEHCGWCFWRDECLKEWRGPQ